MKLLLLLLALQAPYKDAKQHPPQYVGPGREDPEPAGLREVAIAYFGPADGGVWQGISAAFEEANREGGYKGLPFRAVQVWSQNPWTAGVSALARTVVKEHVWAIIGSTDGAAVHLAEQVVTKLPITLINPAATDRTIHQAGLAWVFSCVPGDHAIARAILDHLSGPYTLVSATDHDSRALVAELKKLRSPARHIEGAVTDTEGPVVLVAPRAESARLLDEMRAAGYRGIVYGGPSMPRGDEVIVAVLGETPERFADYAAAHAYDAARILVAAVRKAGLNRARIRDAVAALSPWQGVTGTIRWDALGQNDRAVRLSAPAACPQPR